MAALVAVGDCTGIVLEAAFVPYTALPAVAAVAAVAAFKNANATEECNALPTLSLSALSCALPAADATNNT